MGFWPELDVREDIERTGGLKYVALTAEVGVGLEMIN